jgi:hypothetical protein
MAMFLGCSGAGRAAKSERILERSGLAVATGAVSLALAATGCAGGAEREANQLSRVSIIATMKPLKRNTVTRSEIERASGATGARTLLAFWLSMQHGRYRSALAYFDNVLVSRLGATRLVEVLRGDASLWNSTKPTVVVTRTTHRTARVFFSVHDSLGKEGRAEARFRKAGSGWRITFLSLLERPGSPSP